jgi:hypothetical protein
MSGEAKGRRRFGILEPDPGGHRFLFVRLLALHAPAGATVLLTTPGARGRPEFDVHLRDLMETGDLTVTEVPEAARSRSLLQRGIDAVRLGRLVGSFDVVAVPDGDRRPEWWYLLPAVARRTRVSVLLTRPVRPRRMYATSRRLIATWSKGVLAVVATVLTRRRLRVLQLDLPVGSPSKLALTGWLTPVRDPVPPAAADPVRPRTRSGVVIAGALSRRKGLEQAVDAWKRQGITSRLHLVGRISRDVDPAVRAEIDELVGSGRLVAVDRYVEESEFEQAISTAEAVLLPYASGTWSSGIAGRAVRAHTPIVVVGPASGIAEAVDELGIGSWLRDFGGLSDALHSLRAERISPALAAAAASLDDGQDFASSLWGAGPASATERRVRHHEAESDDELHHDQSDTCTGRIADQSPDGDGAEPDDRAE